MSVHRDGRVRLHPDGSIDHWAGDRWVPALGPTRRPLPTGTTWTTSPDPSPFPTMEVATMRQLMRTEPVLVLLNGIAAVVNLILLALVAVGALSLDGGQIAAIVTAVQAVANLAAAIVRAAVVSPETDAARTEDALRRQRIQFERQAAP